MIDSKSSALSSLKLTAEVMIGHFHAQAALPLGKRNRPPYPYHLKNRITRE